MERVMVVSDTSPLIALSHVGLFDLPKKLWGGLYIPQAVRSEIKKDPGRKDLEEAVRNGWLVVRDVVDATAVSTFTEQFGLGESECFVLARELGAYLLVMDEKRGRKTAEQMGLRVIGVIGLLRLAIDEGILPTEDIHAILSRLTQVGFRFPPNITEEEIRVEQGPGDA